MSVADYEMDPQICNDPAYKDSIIHSLLSIPSLSVVTNIGYLFSHSTDSVSGGIYIYTNPPAGGLGEDWERPVSIEYLIPNSYKNFQTNCGVKLHGGHSRLPEKNPKHSFRLIFKEEYGFDELTYPLFENSKVNEFKTLVLRAGFNNTWNHHSSSGRNRALYVRDPWAKDTQLEMGWPAVHNRYVHLYINRLYWGLYNISERIDRKFMESYQGGNEMDFDIVKDYTEVVDGNLDTWNEMTSKAEGGLSNNVDYMWLLGRNADGSNNDTIKTLLNVENLIDYMIYKHFFNGGVLTHEKIIKRFNIRIREIEKAIIAESARWGDY